MFGRNFIICSCVFVLSGCTYNDEPVPEIVRGNISSRPRLIQPRVINPKPSPKSVYRNVPKDWLPPSRVEKKWTAIVVHHSGTGNGNAAIFDKWHREGNHWDGVGYDFVIGNGTDSGDGQVEVTFRWRKQVPGAHCGGTPGNWANEDGVGICLVGNFNNTEPTSRQMQSLLKLVSFLQSRYNIPSSRVYGHNTTPGGRKTDCPGRKFLMTRFKSMLGS